jgi:hypothetical protein
VRISLKGFTKEWEVFMKCVVVHEHLPVWIILWDNFNKEEIQEGPQSSGQKGDGVDEENVSLGSKGKGKKKGNSGRDLSKVRCYYCNQLGNLASQCPE